MAQEKNFMDQVFGYLERLSLMTEKAKEMKPDDKVIADLARKIREQEEMVAEMEETISKLEEMMDNTQQESRFSPDERKSYYLRSVKREKLGGEALVIVADIKGNDERVLGLDEWLGWEMPEDL